MRQMHFKSEQVLVVVFVIGLLFCPGNLWAGGEPPSDICDGGTYVYTDPPIIGLLTMEKKDESTMVVTFYGSCNKKLVYKKQCVDLGLIDGGFEALTPAHLIDFGFRDFSPPECKSLCGNEAAVIEKVLSFNRKKNRIDAKIVIKHLECPTQ